MTGIDTKAILERVVKICLEAGKFQLQHFREVAPGQISDKGLHQLVSFVDIETENMLVKELAAILPEAGFVTEENTVESAAHKDYVWIIDPLDGTTNYLHGLPAFCVSVGLTHLGEPLLGVVYVPVWNETFTAIKGQGARLNEQPIHCSSTELLADSLIATGFPYYEFEYMDAYLSVLRQLMKQSHGLRRMGSAAIDLVYTACGRFDGFFELGLNAWDVAAGALIVREAGGMVADFKGGNNYLFGKQIIASSASIYAEFLELLADKFHPPV